MMLVHEEQQKFKATDKADIELVFLAQILFHRFNGIPRGMAYGLSGVSRGMTYICGHLFGSMAYGAASMFQIGAGRQRQCNEQQG